MQWNVGLPPGLAERLHWRDYAALSVGVADRYDLIFLKAFAAVEGGPHESHYKDLLALRPSSEELAEALGWVSTQDQSPQFPLMIENMRRRLARDLPRDAP